LILVTGGTGFLGRNLLPILVESGYQVRVISRHPQDYPWLKSLPVEVIQADIEDGGAMHRAAQGAQYILHGAGLFRFWGKSEDFRDTNILGTRNMLEAARSAKVEKLVHISTIAVAGFPRDPRQIIDENYPPQPTDDYQRSKLKAEELVLDYYRQEGLPVVILRGGAFYGPHGRYGFNQVFIEDPLFNFLPLGVDGGRHIMFPAYIKDVARGALLALEKGRPGELYNLCSQSLSHKDINRVVAEVSQKFPFRFYSPGLLMVLVARVLTWISELRGREMHYVMNMQPYTFGEWNVSIEKAKRELGFIPTPFEQGIRETLDWYQEVGLWRKKAT
jgi:nucleoside-diphosphate-sugar epimerase